jgi:hypothetical protein
MHKAIHECEPVDDIGVDRDQRPRCFGGPSLYMKPEQLEECADREIRRFNSTGLAVNVVLEKPISCGLAPGGLGSLTRHMVSRNRD